MPYIAFRLLTESALKLQINIALWEAYLCNGWTGYDGIFAPGVKSPVDFRMDVRDPPHQT